MRRIFIILAACLAASAAEAKEPAVSGKAVLAAPCFNCHGTDGKGTGTIPAIKGRPAEALLRQLQEYKAGGRSDTVMSRLAKGYSDEQLEALAQYFATGR